MTRAHVLPLLLLAACGGSNDAPLPPLPDTTRSLAFSVVRADQPTTASLTLTNPFASRAELTLLEELSEPFSLAFAAARVDGDASQTLDVVVTPPGPDTLAGEFVLRWRQLSSNRTQDVRVTVSAEAESPQLTTTPARLAFDALGSQVLTITNRSAVTPITVGALATLPEELRAIAPPLPATLAPGDALFFTLEVIALPATTLDLEAVVETSAGAVRVPVTVEPPVFQEREITEFGAVTLVGGASDILEVELGPDAVSLTIEATDDSGSLLGLGLLEGPDGVVYENASLTGPFFWLPTTRSFAATLPNSDDDEVQLVPGGGTYRFRLRRFTGSTSSLQVRAIVLNRPDATAVTGELALNVFLAQGLEVDETDARLQGILAETDRIFSSRGLRLGDIGYYTLDEARFDDITSDGQFRELLTQSSIATEERLNLFFVRTAFGNGVLGVAARIGGPTINGTRNSGVMVDYDFGSVATSGYVTAHEIGHFMGLFHTVERTGSHDIIGDTAECPATGTSADCPIVGNRYLMHWQVLPFDPVITPGQANVLLVHPFVRIPRAPSTQAVAAPAPGPIGLLPDNWCGCRDHVESALKAR
ncbi:MAG: M12 family metallo-peptidase [Planctomycetota bacterium]